MKRCPKCEFLYEDDQGLCDMDGAELAYESGPFPNDDPDRPASSSRSRWRSLALIAIIGTVLAGVIFVVNRNPTRTLRSKPDVRAIEPAAAKPQTSSPTPEAEPVIAPAPPNASPGKTARRGLTWDPEAGTPPSRLAPVASPAAPSATPATTNAPKPVSHPVGNKSAEEKPRPPAASQSSTGPTPKPGAVNQKKESRVTSILKKTGRLLKKPFGF